MSHVVQPSRSFLIGVLDRAARVSQLFQAHAQAILHGYSCDLAFLTKLTQRLCHLRAIRPAAAVFSSVPSPDPFLLRTLIRGFSLNGLPFHSLSLYCRLRDRCPVDGITHAFAVSAAAELTGEESSRYVALLHCHSVVDGFGGDSSIGSALAGFYYRVSNLDYARKVFDEITERDTVVWNTVISGLVRNGFAAEALRVFGDMVRECGSGLSSGSLVAALRAVSDSGEVTLGVGVHCLGVKLGADCEDEVATSLVSMYAKCGVIESARRLFGEIRCPDLVSCNGMIDGFNRNNDTASSVWLFKRLLALGVSVNSRTVGSVIPVSSPYGYSRLVGSIHSFGLKYGVLEDLVVSTSLVTAYSKLNEIGHARRVFDETPEKLLPSWNAMISGYAQNGLMEPAISLFGEMLYEFTPNSTTVASVLSACAQLGTLSLGKWLHSLIRSQKLETNKFVQTALINMYAKCGSMAQARELFDSMNEKSVITWNAMISGYGLHGDGHEATRLFEEMSRFGVLPDRVTYLSVLYACSQAGMVRVGQEIFDSMIRDRRFNNPSVEYYACMVDLFGRAGDLDRALKLITEMPVQPDVIIWRSLLGACMIHRDTRIAQVASEKISELDPENSRHHVLLSNIYAAEGSFIKASSVRYRRGKKIPGYAVIEIDQTTHMFKSGDAGHARATEIYAMLDYLMAKTEEAGYRTNTESALKDFEEEDKAMLVRVHSEKLAIAFGLIATEPSSGIRIVKNLRTCLDCHSFAKLVSKVMERVIVIRDGNRFHHFQDGVCSCGDYW